MTVTDLSPVEFTGDDLETAKRFTALQSTVEFGKRRFPAPGQYHDLVTEMLSEDPSAAPERLYALAQRDWHVRGQNGCQFARLAALKADSLKWQYLVFADVDEAGADAVGRHLSSIHRDPAVEVVSLLFPQVRSGAQIVDIMRLLVARTSFWFERDDVLDCVRRLYLRFPVGRPAQTVEAWVMGFAPFDFMPNTRRGPYTELAIRVKEKPEWIFHRLTQDRDVAHLADVPLTMSDTHWEHRWQATLARTRMVLGGEPDEISAAKSTFALPMSATSQDFEQ